MTYKTIISWWIFGSVWALATVVSKSTNGCQFARSLLFNWLFVKKNLHELASWHQVKLKLSNALLKVKLIDYKKLIYVFFSFVDFLWVFFNLHHSRSWPNFKEVNIFRFWKTLNLFVQLILSTLDICSRLKLIYCEKANKFEIISQFYLMVRSC